MDCDDDSKFDDGIEFYDNTDWCSSKNSTIFVSILLLVYGILLVYILIAYPEFF